VFAYPFCNSRNGRLRFACTSFLHFPQGCVDLGKLVHGRIQIGKLYLAHIRQHRQLVEIVADGFLLPQDFLQAVKNDDMFSKAAGGQATKIIIPSEIQGIAGLAKSVVEVGKEN